MQILLLDDSIETLEILSEILRDLGHEPIACQNAEEALQSFERHRYPIVITDIRMPGIDGLTFFKRLRTLQQRDSASKSTAEEGHLSVPSDVIILTGHGDMEMAIEALRLGAYDFLHKPIDARTISAVIERAIEHQTLLRENRELTSRFERKVVEKTLSLRKELDKTRETLLKILGIGTLIAESEAMRQIVEEAMLYHTDSSVPVLIEGETGTGKELIARLIHYGRGERPPLDSPFIDINCAAIAPELFESELFGYEGGAFTGARREGAEGKLAAANGGTLFLDEIGEMPLSLQPKLLRVLQERTWYPVGGTRRMEFRGRIICATNRNLRALVEKGTFRGDLFHRLHVGYLRIPPLRERKEEIPLLARHFLERYASQKKKRFHTLSEDAMALLLAYDWPGNVRELEHAIERAVLMGEGEVMTAAHLSFLPSSPSLPQSASPTPTSSPEKGQSSSRPILPVRDFELPDDAFDIEAHYNAIIAKALEKFGHNKTAAAKYLGLSRFALQRWTEKWGE